MDYATRLRLLTSLGIAVLITVGGFITASLLQEAIEKFGTGLVLLGFVIVTVTVFLTDLLTTESKSG